MTQASSPPSTEDWQDLTSFTLAELTIQPIQGSSSSVTATLGFSATVSLKTSTNLSLTVRKMAMFSRFWIDPRILSCRFLYSRALTLMVKLLISGLRLVT